MSSNGRGAGDDAASVFTVSVVRGDQGWEVRIVDPAGTVASTRACSGEAEARSYASTVNQHRGWLSAEKFREYYRL
jgi:hypothetical protein